MKNQQATKIASLIAGIIQDEKIATMPARQAKGTADRPFTVYPSGRLATSKGKQATIYSVVGSLIGQQDKQAALLAIKQAAEQPGSPIRFTRSGTLQLTADFAALQAKPQQARQDKQQAEQAAIADLLARYGCK